jgi:predicted PurR-regulated permease PerM
MVRRDRQIMFWTGLLVVVVLLMWALGNVLTPFIAGLILAYLLDPLADRFERMGIGRLGATLVILGLFVLFFILALVILIPLLASQISGFVARLPDYVSRLQAIAVEQGGPWFEQFGGPDALKDVQASVGEFMGQGARWLTGFLQSLWSGGAAIVSVFALLVITPVVAFYLLVDWDKMVNKVDSWLPREHRETIRQLAREIDGAIAGFIRGQTVVCLILGTFYGLGLWAIGINSGVLIGFVAGILTIIPYVGSLTGLILAVGAALIQFWPDWKMPLAAIAIFAFGQFVEGNILSPKLVGASVGLHPVWLIFALLAFGSLFGFVGLLIAVPVAAIIGVLARFALSRYLASPLYGGGPRAPGPETDA